MIFTFFIKDLYTTTEIEEPEGWKDLMSELDRQFDTHGMFFSYAGGGDKAGTVFELGFACEGKTLLEAEYQAKGTEGFYQFGVDEAANEFVTPTNIFLGDIDFETRGFDEEFFTAQINQITNLVKLKNRGGLKINLNKGLSLDGNTLGNINFDDSIISLATKEFKQIIATNDGETLDSVQSNAVTTETFLFGGIGFLAVESEELKKFSNPKTVLQTSEKQFTFLTSESEAALQLNFDIDVDINFTEDQGSGTTTYLAQIILNYDQTSTSNTGAPINLVSIANDVNIAASPNNGSITLAVNVDRFVIVAPGTKISADLTLTMQTTGTAQFSAVLDVIKFDITVTDKIGVVGTRSQWYGLHDVLNKNLSFITNEYDYLFSELLGGDLQGYDAEGCFSNMFITNGYRIRQIEDDNKTLQTSFKEFISNLNVFSAIGYGIEELESPVSLGINEIFWVGIFSDIATIRIIGVNLIYDLIAGSNIGFYNSEDIYGFYEITEVTFNPAYTIVKFDVAKNTNYFGFIGNNPPKDITYTDVYIVTDTTTEFRNRLRVENWEHFYNDVQLIDLGVVQDYSEEPFNETIYNEIEVGFRKHSNDEEKATTLEEIHTDSTWGVQIIKARNKLSLISTWIGSTFLFNDSRERIFSVKPTTSHVLDNDIFFCEKAEKEGTYTVSFFTSPDFIQMPADAFENIINGSGFFFISGANEPYNDGSYLIDPSKEVVFKIDTNEYLVSVTSVAVEDADDEVVITSTSLTQKLFKPESNDKLLTSSGITRPTYIMNQRRTLKRFLIRWGRFINSFLAYLVDGATVTIHNLTFDNNGEFTSELDTSQVSGDCLMGDLSGASIQEDDNINTDSFPAAKFKPNIINCTVKICDSDYEMILAAHKNRLQSPDDGKNYGYFVTTSPMGARKSGWLMNMKRSPVDRIAKLRLLERIIKKLYNFSGIEKVSIAGVPAFEKTSTFYLKAVIANKGLSPGSPGIIWSTTASLAGNPGLSINLNSVDKTIIIAMRDSGGRSLIALTGAIFDHDVLNEIEIWYDGSADVSGLSMNANGSPIVLNLGFNNLVTSIDTGAGASFGIQRDIGGGGPIWIERLEWTMDGSKEFETNCEDNGDLTCVDLSGKGNDGIINLNATPREEFFIEE